MAKANDLLIEVRPGRTRIARIEAGRLVELLVEDDSDPSLVGNIYLGRVEKVIDSLNAAFIDLGLGRSGFLAVAEARPAGASGGAGETISRHVREGEKVVVQILRDGFEDKGPKLTTRLALGGRTVIMTPDDPAIRISRRIDGEGVRKRLDTLLQGLAGPQEGLIARTTAAAAGDADIAADIETLREACREIKTGRETASPPQMLWGPPQGAIRALLDWQPGDVERVIIDDTQAYLEARAFLEKQAPGLTGWLVHHKGSRPLMMDEDLEDDIERALSARVNLPGGGSVIFSETPALVAIDVNTAGTSAGGREQSALKSNLEAAREIARQIRLRNLSGLLVIDFVSMKSREKGVRLLDVLKKAVVDDPSQVFVGGFTRFGLIEMTRKRERPSLAANLLDGCPPCSGYGFVASAKTRAYRALDELAVEAAADPSRDLALRVSEKVAMALSGPVKAALQGFEKTHGRPVTIIVEGSNG